MDGDAYFRLGGTTIGAIVIGSAIGNLFGHAPFGAVLGGIAGISFSTWDEFRRLRRKP